MKVQCPMTVLVTYRDGSQTRYKDVFQLNEELPHACVITYGLDRSVDIIPWEVIRNVEVQK